MPYYYYRWVDRRMVVQRIGPALSSLWGCRLGRLEGLQYYDKKEMLVDFLSNALSLSTSVLMLKKGFGKREATCRLVKKKATDSCAVSEEEREGETFACIAPRFRLLRFTV